VATETIRVGDRSVQTLRELIRPGLRGVFVGINPSPTSVAAGHYYQGRLGKRFWTRLQDARIVGPLPTGHEDDAAFQAGFGFADLIRRPTRGAHEIAPPEWRDAAVDLAARLAPARGAVVVFVFARARDEAGTFLRRSGWVTEAMPGPYAPREEVDRRMRELRVALGGSP
jgi:TDG/mug DNA glycosylase family protein